MGKKHRDVADQNDAFKGQKVDEPAGSDIINDDVLTSNHKKKKKKRNKVDTNVPDEYADAAGSGQEMVENPKKKKKGSNKKNDEIEGEENKYEETVDIPRKKKRKHHQTKTVPSGDDEVEFEEMTVVPKKKKKRKHHQTKTVPSGDDEVEFEEMTVVPKKKKKRKLKKTENVPSGDDIDEVEFEEMVVVPKKKKKRKHDKDNSLSDETNENVTVENSSDESKDGEEAKDDVNEETRQKLKQDWQDKTSLKKLRMQQPKMFLIDNFTNDEDSRMTFKPVEVQDLQDLIQYSVLGNISNTNKVRFCKLIRPLLIAKVAVIVLNGVTDEHFLQNPECFPNLSKNYDLTGEILHLSSKQQQSILNQLINIAISKKQLKKRAYFAKIHGVSSEQSSTGATPNSTPLPARTTPLPARTTPLPARTTPSTTPCRTHYLLNDDEKSMWRYPKADDPDYTHTKHSDTVNDTSPIISVDCEMCVTKKGSELTRVSLVDEKRNVLYNSLVKPHNPIIDYVTRYSGITKQLLDPVTVRLEDAQRDIIALLPSDAILVGQSLENDLRALKLYHPHVIDTSNLFTGSYRVALRKLAWKYLGVTIQEQDTGHDSIEDAIVALQLLQLKIERGSGLEKYHSNGSKKQGIEVIPTESLFRCAQSLRKVSMLIDSLSVAKQFMKDPVGAIPCQNDSEALKKTVQSLPYSDFVCVQFHNFSKLMQGITLEGNVVKETLKQLDQRIKKIYKTLPFNSFFLVVMASDLNNTSNKGSNVQDSPAHGRFFTGLKVKY